MSVTLMIMGRRRPGQTLSAHRQHMRHVHAPLVLDYIAREPDAAPRRYVQNHVFDSVFGEGDPGASIFARQHDFLTEVGFPDMATARASRETPHYLDKLRPDEGRMVDESSVTGFPVLSRARTDWSGTNVEPVKVAILVGFVDGVDADEAQTRWTVLSSAFTPPVPAHCDLGHVPVPGPVRAVALFRVDGEPAARTLADAYRQAVIEPLVTEGLLSAESHCVLLAREYVLHAGEDQRHTEGEDVS